jgi:hypothetical protein
MAYVAKTRKTDADVQGFLDRAEPLARREDGRTLCALMERVSGLPPKMWGPTIVGFGVRSYAYASGHSGEMCAMGFSPRKPALVLYLGASPERGRLLDRLGKYSQGNGGCIYVKKLADVDMAALEDLVAASWSAASS